MVNAIAGSAAEIGILGANSSFVQYVDELTAACKEEGAPLQSAYSSAVKTAFLEFFVKQPLVAFGQGALSAGIMQGLANTVGMIKQKHADKQIAVIEAGRYLLTTEAQEFDDLSPAAQKIVKENFSDHPQDLQAFIQQKSPTGSLSKEAQMAIDAAVDVAMGKDNSLGITRTDIESAQSIGRKSLNDFTESDFKKTAKFEKRFWEELKKKSPFYRAKHGDWRVNDRSKVRIVSLSNDDIESGMLKYDFTRGYGTFNNSDTGWNIISGSKGKNDTISHQGRERIPETMLQKIKELIEKSVLLDTQISVNNEVSNEGKITRHGTHPNTLFMHYLYAPVKVGKVNYIAKISIEEYAQSKDDIQKRFYNLRAIKISPAGGSYFVNDDLATMPNTGDTISVADLFKLVKQYDPNFHPKSEASQSSPKSDIEAIADDIPMRHIDGSVRSYKEYAAEQEAKKQEAPPPADTEAPTANPDVAAAVNAPGVKRAEDIELQYTQRLKGKNAMLFKDLPRVLDYVCDKMPGVRDFWRNRVEKPFWKAKASFARRTEAALEDLRQSSEELGILVGSKESAATQWYGEGYRTVQKKNPMYEPGNGEPKYVAERENYTLADLKRDFPDTWENIVAFDKKARSIYEQYIVELNTMLEKIYPDAEVRLQIEISDLRRDINTLRNKPDELFAERETLERDIASIEASIADLKQRRDSGSDIAGTLGALEQRREQKQSEFDALKNQRKRKTHRIQR